MTISIPLIVLIAVVVYVAYRNMGLRAWHAVACMVLGFLLAATGAGPQINDILTEIVRWLGGGR
jgi:hypothetical protein